MTYLFYIIETLLLCVVAFSAAYILFFAVMGAACRLWTGISKGGREAVAKSQTSEAQTHFLVIFPSYNENSVVVDSVRSFLKQDYDNSYYDVFVMSDHNSDATNQDLQTLPVKTIVLHEPKSSKGLALQRAIEQATGSHYDYVVILDADNIVASNFLSCLNAEITGSHLAAYQCHRTSKNSNGDVALLDSLSEEINNTIFRLGHNAVGLSAALIGSGLAIQFDWFCDNVCHLQTAGEDRELEALLIGQDKKIKYLPTIHVMDEKVNNARNFQRQRLRWMTAQLQSLIRMSVHMPSALWRGKIDYVDKTIQQALVPRSLLLSSCTLITFVHLLLTVFLGWPVQFFWLWLATLLASVLAVVLAIPPKMFSPRRIASLLFTFVQLAWLMLCNLIHINHRDTTFIHTEHGKG